MRSYFHMCNVFCWKYYYIVVPFLMFLFSISLPNPFMDKFRIYMFTILSPFLGNCVEYPPFYFDVGLLIICAAYRDASQWISSDFRSLHGPISHMMYEDWMLLLVLTVAGLCLIRCLLLNTLYSIQFFIHDQGPNMGIFTHDHGLLYILIVPKGTVSRYSLK